ncbi:hypothetical protein J7T55_011593 [Diaporthe amygdali]|uniref:uncharacterized protein n=1 Tax=Phomopsis amygdali TaxID=1214568 RepID=UPI0022FE9749|nr:uncharacterized protein J7T55_011593 [Diaporthe amygdali]KAJ0123129.1 hypothetical protein J7T55_011593 [Diaporthe amygdali]
MAALIASNSQDWIASQLSATTADARPSRTNWHYVRDRNGMMVIDPVLGFYFNPPENAECRWSTDNGARVPQHIKKGLQLPRRTLVLWDDEKLESEAARFREKYWEEMRTLVAPQRFEDLYEYFDSATLWASGAVNMWNLVNLLANDARHNWREVEKHVASECNNWVLDWLESFPAADSNRESLVKWDQKSDILTAVTSQFDWENDLKFLDLVGQNILRECFLYHFERLTGKKPSVARFNIHAAEDKPTSARKPVNESADTTTKASSSPGVAPTPSSPAQALATIPEEAAAVKTATKSEGLSIDTSVSTRIPHQTVSAPATAVPRITIEQQPAKEAEDVPEQKDLKSTSEDEFFTNQDLADRVEATARHLSSQSTPGEKQDYILSAYMHNTQPRAVSATEMEGTAQQGRRLQHTFPEKAGTVPRNMNGNQPPFGGSRDFPQGNGPNRQQTSANTGAFPGGQSVVKQGAPMGPSHQQHMMQPFGPPHNGMQPPPPGFIQPTSSHGMPAHPNSFTSSGQDLQPDLGLKPMLGLSGMEFQNQMPTRLPHTEQPQLNHPLAPPTSMPTHCSDQQNAGAPMYQPNGYIPQSQHRPVGETGNKKKRHDERRDSMNSAGSRSKVRDDPIHGPVYALKSRKYSNTSTGRQSSKLDSCSAINSKQPASSPNIECRNFRLDKPKTYNRIFIDCPCFRCMRSCRSLYVKHDKFPQERVQTALMNHFAGWGASQVIVIAEGGGSLVQFKSDQDAIRAMRDLCAKPNQGKDIPGLGTVPRIWYALFSKHYTNPYDNPDGLPRGELEGKSNRRRSSSTLSRDSNPYRNQQPSNVLFNTPTFATRGPAMQPPQIWHGETGGPPHLNMVPVSRQPTQRKLWDPASADENRKPSKTETMTKDEMIYQPKTYPKRPVEVVALKEDWRSKPPAEEVIEDISGDEAGPAEISSNVSSQGARSIKVCLPDEAGSSRSRSVSPKSGNDRIKEQVQRGSPKPNASVDQNEAQAGLDTAQNSMTEAVAKDDIPFSTGYRKATAELAVPVEVFQPTADPEQLQPTEKQGKKGLSYYSKVTSELTEATEGFDVNTVIRHKPSRSPLPDEWMPISERGCSNLRNRFTELSGALELEALENQVVASMTEGTSVAMAPEAPKTEEAPSQQPKKKNFTTNTNKGGRSKKNKSKASNDTPDSALSSATPTEAHSRGPSRASNNRPVSRASTTRPESAGDTTQSPSRSQSATQSHMDPSPVDEPKKPMKKKNTKSQRKRKQPFNAETSATPIGQAKTEGSQDQGRVASRQESPAKKPKTLQSGPAPETQRQSEPEPAKSVDDTQGKLVGAKQDESKKSRSPDEAGGSARPEKNRPPQKPQQKGNRSEENEPPQKQAPEPLQTVFEPPADRNRDDASPEANLFPNQKFTIDKVKKDSAMAAPLMMSEPSGYHRYPNNRNFTTNDARIALPLLPPNAKSSGWATVAVKGGRPKSDDPFASVQDGPEPDDWMKDKAVKSAQKPSSEPTSHQTSPTPSPEKKKKEQRAGSSKLNAAAKAFAPSSIPSSPAASAASVPSVNAVPFHTKKPSLPGQKGAVEQRFITPAEQVIDPATVTQPGPPTKKKRVGPGPDRGDSNLKERAKSFETALAPSRTKSTAQVASTASGVPKLVDEEEFPTLAAAAAVPQRRAASAVKTSATASATASKTATAAVSKAVATTKPSITSPNKIKLGQRGEVSAPAADKPAVGEKIKASEDQWTTVGSGKKAGGKNTGNGNNARSASSRAGGSGTGHGGRTGGQGNRGGQPAVGEERKGG